MKETQYIKTSESKFRGRRVKVLQPLNNGWGTIPAGTIATIVRKWKGFTLEADPCPCCGLRASISKVKFYDVDLLPLGPEPRVMLQLSREEAMACVLSLDATKPYHWRDEALGKLEAAMGLKSRVSRAVEDVAKTRAEFESCPTSIDTDNDCDP